MDHTFDTEMLGAIVPLRAAGFALHWLHAKQKRPIGERWSEAPVASLAQLQQSHARGNNLGVRLGEPSLLASGHYLHALDLDIRVAECADEAWDALRALLPGIDVESLPSVISGSGGASRHLYFVTEKPFFGKKLAVSEGKHRRHDAARAKDVWSYDFEIELFGTGKQVAMPPSIHPDTGKPYLWERPFDFEALEFDPPLVAAAAIEALAVAETATYEFETREPLTFKPGQMERDLDLLPVARLDDYHDWISLGQALHHQFGGSDEGFEQWLAVSKRSEKFEQNDLREIRRKWRGFGRNRRKPVTMATVRQWAQEARDEAFAAEFDDLDDFDAPVAPAASGDDEFGDLLAAPATSNDDLDAFDLSDEEKSEAAELDWRSLFDRNEEGAIKPTLHNLELMLRHDKRFVGLAQLNSFTQEVVQRRAPGVAGGHRKNPAKPTKQLVGRAWTVGDAVNGDLWSEDRDFSIRSVIEAPKTQGGYGLKVSDRDLKAAVSISANEHTFHPIREYLEGLKWDGAERVDTLWVRHVNAPDDAYHREVARLVMVAAVARVFEPGHKFDFATILEGLQGKRKSTLIEVLGKRWFAELDGDFHDQKQMVELMQGAWIMEIPELTGFGRADVRAIKAFISRKKDRVRLAYARRAGQYPRQVIFIGSTNDDQYLRDDTGGRRFWPVKCNLHGDSEIDIDTLEAEVDQLWAEAVVLYRAMRAEQPHGTLPLYVRDPAARVIAARLQESRRVESSDDALIGRIASWLDEPVSTGSFDEEGEGQVRNITCLAELWVGLGNDPRAYGQMQAQSLGRAMGRVPGWKATGRFFSFQRPYGRQRYFERVGSVGPVARFGPLPEVEEDGWA